MVTPCHSEIILNINRISALSFILRQQLPRKIKEPLPYRYQQYRDTKYHTQKRQKNCKRQLYEHPKQYQKHCSGKFEAKPK